MSHKVESTPLNVVETASKKRELTRFNQHKNGDVIIKNVRKYTKLCKILMPSPDIITVNLQTTRLASQNE